MFNNASIFKSPFGSSPFGPAIPHQPLDISIRPPAELHNPEQDLPRVVQYAADTSGCGFWRMFWPDHILNANQKVLCTTTSVIDNSEGFYAPVKAVRVQRQATGSQLEFIKYLKKLQQRYGFRIIYEIDDVVFHEDIPDYNKFKGAFIDPSIRQNIVDIINMCDEATVTNPYMRDYFREKTGKNEITVIPNMPPKWWIGHFFNPTKLNNNLIANKKKPRVLYAGSGAHFDVDFKVGNKDDFERVVDSIIATRHEFTWVFMGSAPNKLIPYIKTGEIELHNWQSLYNYPQKIYDLNVQMMVAPLQDNHFNRCKSDIKYIEAASFGIPIACQDIVTYKNAPIRFNTGDEMIDQIRDTLRRTNTYTERAHQYRKVAEDRFLEHDRNHECYAELFTTPYKSSDRKYLNRFNIE